MFASRALRVSISRYSFVALACALLAASSGRAQIAANPAPIALPQSRTTAAIAEWNRLRTAPIGEIDDPLGLLVDEAGAFRRLALMIQEIQSDAPDAPLDPKLQVALLRSLYLAASIEGRAPDYLLRWAVEARDTSDLPAVRAEAAYRILIDNLTRRSAGRAWGAPLRKRDFDLLMDYLICYGDTPRAVSAVKRLADDAALRGEPEDLIACGELVRNTSATHPIGRAFVAEGRAMEAIGRTWAPRLKSESGDLDWTPLRGRPTIVLFADLNQTPSVELFDSLIANAGDSEPAPYSLVLIQVEVSAARKPIGDMAARVDARRRVRLTGGWRAPLLAELDIRAIPTVLILDDDGALRRIIRPEGWTMDKVVPAAVAELSGVGETPADTTTSQPAPSR
ncbi:MAG TPA: hypothetical protein P5081_03710 [Phycisphaerae bacterium]|nr:hypothetical protein [Phycisphaerae bacterium]HRW51966.1 hypothetical protein [Phycisphaerae bacterium]